MKFPLRTAYFLGLGLLGLSGSSYAEGGSCPAGYYPIGGRGAVGCAPIPNYQANDEQASSAIPQARWAKTWGAIAIDETVSAGGIGVVTGLPDKQTADTAALSQCLSSGGSSSCRLHLSYENQCAVIVSGISYLSTHRAETIERASALAIEKCNKQTTSCKIYYSACTAPVLVQQNP